MTSGISAIGGSARKKLISGSTKRRTGLYQPTRKPTGTATSMPSTSPSTTRCTDMRMLDSSSPCVRLVQNTLKTLSGEGSSVGLISHVSRSSTQKQTRNTKGSSAQPKSPNKRLRSLPFAIVVSKFAVARCLLQQVGLDLYHLRRVLDVGVVDDLHRLVQEDAADIGDRVAYADVEVRGRVLVRYGNPQHLLRMRNLHILPRGQLRHDGRSAEALGVAVVDAPVQVNLDQAIRLVLVVMHPPQAL